MTSHKDPTIYINFDNVPIEKTVAKIIPSKLDEVFNELMINDNYFDINRLKIFIERYKLGVLSSLDNCPHGGLASVIIEDFLYGNNLTDVSKYYYYKYDYNILNLYKYI